MQFNGFVEDNLGLRSCKVKPCVPGVTAIDAEAIPFFSVVSVGGIDNAGIRDAMYELALVNAVKLRTETSLQEQAVSGSIVEIISLPEILTTRNIRQNA